MVWQGLSEMVGGFALGWVIDLLFDQGHLFLWIFGPIGIVLGMTSVIRFALRASKRAHAQGMRTRIGGHSSQAGGSLRDDEHPGEQGPPE
jgi:F0F1-type ATP synthase assembly protein I